MDREYFEQMSLQEEAEMIAAFTALQIEQALRICGSEMLNKQLSGFTVTPTTH